MKRTMESLELYPWPLSPRQVKTIWAGSDWSALFGAEEGGLAGVGELWLNDDRPGGSVVAQGPLAGRDLSDLVSSAPQAVLGPKWAALGRLPILLKFINTAEWLSVQVHPKAGPEKTKNEAWHFLTAADEAQVILGLRPGLDQAAVRRAVEKGCWTDILNYAPARAGQSLFTPAGLIHAIGPGVLIFEIQQNIDVTYRLYDWDRLGPDGRPRGLHTDQALAALKPELGGGEPLEATSFECPGGAQTDLVASPFFTLSRLELAEPYEADTRGEDFMLLTGLEGRGLVRGGGRETIISPGATILLPAGLGRWCIKPEGDTVLLASSA